MLAENFVSTIRGLRYNVDSNREQLPKENNITLKQLPKENNITLTSNVEPLIDSSVFNPNNYSNESVGSILKFYRSKYPEKLLIGDIDINSLRHKFEILKSVLPEVLDILMITETKLDDSFPNHHFHIEGFNMRSRLDRNRYGGGSLLYVCNNINAVWLKSYVFPDKIEYFFIEILLKSCKRLKTHSQV